MSKQNKKHITSSIEINAPVEKVWGILTRNEEWEYWNPFIVKSEGKIAIGRKIKNTMVMDGKKMAFKPIINSYVTNEEVTWTGNLIIPGLFDGKHTFKLQKLGDESTLLIQEEVFSGILSGWFASNGLDKTLANFEKMNKALKAVAEEI